MIVSTYYIYLAFTFILDIGIIATIYHDIYSLKKVNTNQDPYDATIQFYLY
jgi:hypothetical protein